MSSLEWQWELFRACILTLVMILHFPLVILSIVAFVQGSGGAIQIVTIVLDSFILAAIAIHLLLKAFHSDEKRDRKVDLWTFGSLTSFSFILWILLLARVQPSATGSLVDDYASIGGSSAYVGNIVSCLATFGLLFSCLGLAATLVDNSIPGGEGRRRRLLRLPFGLSHSLSSLRPMSPELVWDDKTRRAYLPDGTPAKLVTAPMHADRWTKFNRCECGV